MKKIFGKKSYRIPMILRFPFSMMLLNRFYIGGFVKVNAKCQKFFKLKV
jgi:hypothetical protein